MMMIGRLYVIIHKPYLFYHIVVDVVYLSVVIAHFIIDHSSAHESTPFF